jgi:uncharacterized radical SAM superfamily Fe-S cluster-containing enzyme
VFEKEVHLVPFNTINVYKFVFKGKIKRELSERLEKWVNMDNTKDLPKDKLIKYHLSLMQEIKVKQKMVLA